MPSYTRGILRDTLTFVKMQDPTVLYGWKTKDLANITGVSAADTASLGHLLAANVPAGSLAMLGANAPKPPRVRKVINATPSASTQTSVSTYCAPASLGTAAASGWDIVKGGRGVNFNNGISVTLAAKLSNGLYYTFPKNSADATTYAAELGLVLPGAMTSAERKKSVRGSSKPRPAKVRRSVGARGNMFFFVSDDKIDDALAGGWQLVEESIPYTIGV